MNRIFFFGCSYTHFAWPTWADLLGISATGYSIPGGPQSPTSVSYNFGYSGGSNSNTINRILIADQQFKFCSTDIICVQWTSRFRHTFAHTLINHTRVQYDDPNHSIPHCYWQEVYAHRLLAQIKQLSGAKVFDFDFIHAEFPNEPEISDVPDENTQLMDLMINHNSDNLGWDELASAGGFDRSTDAWWNKTQHIDAHPSPHEHLCVARSVHEHLGLGDIKENAVQHAADATDMLNYLWDKQTVEPQSSESDAWQLLTQTVRKSHVAEVHTSDSMVLFPNQEPDAHHIDSLLRKP